MGNQHHAPISLPRERDPAPTAQEAGWALEPVWTGTEYLAPTTIRSQDHPACIKLLYWLCYPAQSVSRKINIIPIYFMELNIRFSVGLHPTLSKNIFIIIITYITSCVKWHDCIYCITNDLWPIFNPLESKLFSSILTLRLKLIFLVSRVSTRWYKFRDNTEQWKVIGQLSWILIVA
jgi:hypothetical protein